MNLLLLSLLLMAPVRSDPLTIHFVPNVMPDSIEYDKPFQVILTNTSDKPICLWKHESKHGYYQLTFQFIHARTGAKHVASKREMDGDEVWKLIRNGDDRASDTVTIAPRATKTIEVNFSEFAWGDRMWKGLPSPNIADPYRVSVQFESKASPDAPKGVVWTGNLSSKELTIHYLATKLKTPVQYLWEGYPDRAIEMMKADPKSINQADDEDKCMPLHHAARFAHLKAVLWLLNNGADVNAKAYNDFTPLHFAEDPEVVELILQKKPDLSPEGSGPAFHHVLSKLTSASNEPEKKKWKKIVDLYLQAGAEYDLFAAIQLNDLNQVQQILAKSPSQADNFQDRSPLRLAASLGRLEICQYLIEKHGVDINDFDRGWGYPIIKEAVKYPQIVKLLIDHKVDLKTRVTQRFGRSGLWIIGSNATILHYAAQDGVPESAKLLLDAGVDLFTVAEPVIAKDNQPDLTALNVAAIFGKADIVEVMLQHPQFKSAKAEARQTALDQCLYYTARSTWNGDGTDRYKLVELLIAQGANPIVKVNGLNYISVVTERLHPPSDSKENDVLKKMITLLRKQGAPLTLYGAVAIEDEAEVNRLLKLNPRCASDRRSDGYPAIHFAVDLNNMNIVKALLKAGCNVNLQNLSDHMGGYEGTPLHAAAFWGQYNIAKLLIEAGADINAVSTNKYNPSIKSTPLSEAKRLNNHKIAKLLIEKGAKE